MDVYSQAADGASPPRVELAAPGTQFPLALTPDGTRLLVSQNFADIGMVTLGQPDRLEPLLYGPADQGLPDVSADGRWIAYESNESGSQTEIFARPFPHVTAGRTKISVDGGRYPLFSPDGREIYYLEPDGDMMAAAVTFAPSLEVGSVRKLFTWRKPHTGGVPYSVSPLDGRFLVPEPFEGERETPVQIISVVLNWFSELTGPAPTNP
jgi:serine/threonine-protein kinase